MGKRKQHVVHRMMDSNLKNVYKGHMLVDGEGTHPTRRIRDHKGPTWWALVKSEQAHKRKEEGKIRTMEGRRTMEHEDLVREVIGEDWQERLEASGSVEGWMDMAQAKNHGYYNKVGLPPDPKHVNWLEEKERRRKEEKKKGMKRRR